MPSTIFPGEAVGRDYRFWVYIMGSRTGTLYTGVTNTVYGRTMTHKSGEEPGFTSRYGCDRLLWYEEHSHVNVAIAREKEIKGWTRAKKLALIRSMNPRFEDLARSWGKELDIKPGLMK